jgi:NADPH:quinone reductase-like Zn-dependent oxidoreductase
MLSAEDAAAVPFAAFEAHYFIAKAKIQPGEKLLTVGAGGSIGTYAVQIAKALGAEVTVVDRPSKHAMLREIGADHVLRHTATDWGKGDFDVVFDVVGKRTFGRGLRALHRGGRYVSANPKFTLLFRALFARIVSGKRVMVGTAGHGEAAITAITALIESGKVKPVIGKRFTLDQIVEEHRYAESGEKNGNAVIIVDPAAAQSR